MNKTCKENGCMEKTYAKGLCRLHYKRQWLTGSTQVGRPCLHGKPEKRFWNHVVKNENGCWDWNGFKDKDGYGKMRTTGTNEPAHRVSYKIHHGPIPDGLMVLHKCNNSSCCNPDHLYCGTQKQNMSDRINAGNFNYGEDHHNCKIPNNVVVKIKEATGTLKEVAVSFGCSPSQVANIRNGRQRVIK